MKGYKFYLEYQDNKSKRKATRKELGNHSGNVVAVIDDTKQIHRYTDETYDICSDAIGALMFHANSIVCSTSVSNNYLNEKCKRISEKLAREIHSNLFSYLDSEE